MGRVKTRDEVQREFVEYARAMIRFWANEPLQREGRPITTQERVSGVVHSIFVAIDGCSDGLPPFSLVPQNGDEAREGDEDWYPEEDIGGGLHEELYRPEREARERARAAGGGKP
jgi:hypothetical protein